MENLWYGWNKASRMELFSRCHAKHILLCSSDNQKITVVPGYLDELSLSPLTLRRYLPKLRGDLLELSGNNILHGRLLLSGKTSVLCINQRADRSFHPALFFSCSRSDGITNSMINAASATWQKKRQAMPSPVRLSAWHDQQHQGGTLRPRSINRLPDTASC